jgi:integrase
MPASSLTLRATPSQSARTEGDSCAPSRGRTTPLHEGGGRGRRVVQRARRAHRRAREVLSAATALMILAGPGPGVSGSEWGAVVRRGRQALRGHQVHISGTRREQFALSRAQKHGQVNLTQAVADITETIDQRARARRPLPSSEGGLRGQTLLLQPEEHRYGRCRREIEAPLALAVLLGRSSLSSEMRNVGQVSDSVEAMCDHFVTGETKVEEEATSVFVVGGSANPYSVSATEKKELFRLTDPKELALPPEGNQGIPISRFIGPQHEDSFPFNEVFTEKTLRASRLPPDEVPAMHGHKSWNLAPGVTKVAIAKKLIAHGVADLYVSPEMLNAVTNGHFSLVKKVLPTISTRWVFDGVHGNINHTLDGFQAAYTAALQREPERALTMGLSPKIMDIPNPTDLCAMPMGAYCISSGDYSNWFFQLAQFLWMLKLQCLGLFPGWVFGRPEPWVMLAVKVLAMGNFLSALVAHVVHRIFLARVFVNTKKPLRAVQEQWASEQHQADLRTVRSRAAQEPDGLVAWTDVPITMRKKLQDMLGEHGVRQAGAQDLGLDAQLRVPVDALTLEPCGDKEPLLGQPAVRMVTRILGGQRNARSLVENAQADDNRTDELLFVFLAVAYQDDNDTATFPSKRVSSGEATKLSMQAGGLHRLLTVLAADAVGFRQNFDKLQMPRFGKHVSLGVELDILGGGMVTFAVKALKRRRIHRALLDVLASGARFVDLDLLESLLGNVVWCLLVLRCLLSVLRLVYKAVAKAKRRGWTRVHLFDRFREELWLAAWILPLAETHTANFTNLLYTYDASGENKYDCGGYGVATRDGLTPEVATELTTVVGIGGGKLPMFRVEPDWKVPSDRQGRLHAEAATQFLHFDWSGDAEDTWRAARQGIFAFAPRHINVGECYAGAMAHSHSARRKGARGCLQALGGDNTTADHSLVKGRSSVRDINDVMRGVAVRTVIYDVRGVPFWIPSKANSSDGPSRWESERRQQKLGRLARNGGYQDDPDRTSGEAKKPGPPRTPWHRYKGRKPSREDITGAPLRILTLSIEVDSARVYVQAMDGFLSYIHDNRGKHETMEDALIGFISTIYFTGVAPKATAINLLSAIGNLFNPQMKAAGGLKLPQRALSGWRKMASGKSWLPVPEVANLMFAWHLLLTGDEHDTDTAIGAMIAFHIYARGAELDALRVADVVMPGDPHNIAPKTAAVCFHNNKSGRPQMVRIDREFFMWLARIQLQRLRRRAPSPLLELLADTPFFDFGPGGFLPRYKWAQVLAGYLSSIFVRHSLRHGGSTDDHAKGDKGGGRPVVDISVRLRHANPKTTLVYLQDAQAQLAMEARPQRMTSDIAAMGGIIGIKNAIIRLLRHRAVAR